MSQKSTISITYKLDGDNSGFKKLSVDADGFRKIMGTAVVEAEKLKSSIVNFAALVTGFDSVNKAIGDLQSVLSDLSKAYSAQIEAETKLAVNMRNTMSAREEDIQSIRDLCAAQQELGVIGDEVQLAGAQELATYLSEKQSLEQLILVMNDMLAQQYGLNATQESAAQIATMLGKVMDGQTAALSRYGYSFDAVQEQILKYGTEAQRAAVLSEVVSASVGGMNTELAKTDVGKQKQLENTLGDIKERLGALAQSNMPLITMAAETSLAANGAVKLFLALKALALTSASAAKKMLLYWRATAVISSSTKGLTKGIATARLFVSQFCTAVTQGTKGLKLFAMAWKGMLISTGLGVAIAAVTSIIAYFALSTDKATDSTNNFLDAGERAKRNAEQLEQLRQQEVSTLTNTRAALEINISKLKEFNGTKEQEKKLVNEMNDTYGDTMGYFSSVSGWYDALISNSEAYCRQMIIEARTRMLANQIAEKEQRNHDIIYDDDGNVRRYSNKRDREQVTERAYDIHGNRFEYVTQGKEIKGTSEVDKARAEINANEKAVANLRKQLTDAAKEAANIKLEVKGSEVRPSSDGKGTTPNKKELVWTESPRTLREYTNNISLLEKELQDADKAGAITINRQIAALKKEADAIRNAGVEVKNNQAVWHEEAKSITEVEENLSYLSAELNKATTNEGRAKINQQIEAQRNLADYYKGQGKILGTILRVDPEAFTLKGIDSNIAALNSQLSDASLETAAVINKEIEVWEKKADAIRNAGKTMQDSKSVMTDAIGSIGNSMSNLGNALELPEFNVVGTMMQAIATMVQGYASATAQASAMGPFAWLAFAATGLAQLTTMVSAVKALPAFADGGIVSGPTVGLIGEYAGASNNPEVVAPLDKLRGMLQPADGFSGGVVKFKIDGRTLVGILEKENNLRYRS